MIHVSNLRTYTDKDFREYCKMPGKSFSSFKSFPAGFTPTYKMQLGSAIDAYLTKPEKYDGFEYNLVRNAAIVIRQRFGELFNHMQKQLAITADFEYHGFVMPYKGLPDFCIPRKIIVDLKCVDKEIASDYFDYPAQLSGYAIPLECPLAFILEFSREKHACRFVPVTIKQDFWIKKILQYGEYQTVH